MELLRKSKKKGAATAPGDEPAPVLEARTRARRRLIGAVVLLAVGVVGFPIVFETQPRPVALDTPIEVAGRPPAPAPRPASASVVVETPPAETMITERAAPPPRLASAPKVEQPRGQTTIAGTAPPPPSAPAPSDDGARARALLDDAAASAPKTPRFIVQAGAYTDAAALRDARQRVEKLGLKTYTQVVETDGGKRTRVRTGPYASREEADAAAARLKAAGVAAQVLLL